MLNINNLEPTLHKDSEKNGFTYLVTKCKKNLVLPAPDVDTSSYVHTKLTLYIEFELQQF